MQCFLVGLHCWSSLNLWVMLSCERQVYVQVYLLTIKLISSYVFVFLFKDYQLCGGSSLRPQHKNSKSSCKLSVFNCVLPLEISFSSDVCFGVHRQGGGERPDSV